MKFIATIENELCITTMKAGRMVFKSLISEKAHPQETSSKELPTFIDLFNTIGKLTSELVAKIDDQQLKNKLNQKLFRIADLALHSNNTLAYNSYRTVNENGKEVDVLLVFELEQNNTITVKTYPAENGRINNPTEIEQVKITHDTNCIVNVIHYLGIRCALDIQFN